MIFPAFIEHEQMESLIRYFGEERVHTENWEAVAAGFVKVEPDPEQIGGFVRNWDAIFVVTCFGESDSLNLKSRGPIDAELMKKLIE